MTIIQIILAFILSTATVALLSSIYLYFIYVIPFIWKLEGDSRLLPNHGLYRYVLFGSVGSLLLGLIIILFVHYFGSSYFIKWFNVGLIVFTIGTLAKVHIFKGSNRDNEKRKVISNFQAVISKKLKDPAYFERYLHVDEVVKEAQMFAEQVLMLSTEVANKKGLTGEACNAEVRRLFLLATSLSLDSKNSEHTEAIQIRRQAQVETFAPKEDTYTGKARDKMIGEDKFSLNKVEDASIEQQKAEICRLPECMSTVKTKMLAGEDCDEVRGAVGAFGLTPTNPIPVNGVHGEIVYLNRLHEKGNGGVFFHRIGSLKIKNLENSVDVFETVSSQGRWEILYFDIYHPRRSTLAPEGFELAPFGKINSMIPIGFGITGLDPEFPFGVPASLEKEGGSLGVTFAKRMRTILEAGRYVRPEQQTKKISEYLKDDNFSLALDYRGNFFQKSLYTKANRSPLRSG